MSRRQAPGLASLQSLSSSLWVICARILNLPLYGWTEFDIAPDSELLTVTTYGLVPYTELDLAARGNLIAGSEPFIVSQFVVRPTAVPEPGSLALLAGAALLSLRAARRRS